MNELRISINSKFKKSGTNSNFVYVPLNKITNLSSGQIIKIKQIAISDTFYSVRNGFNSKVKVITGAENHDIFIPEGTYSWVKLASIFESELNNNFTGATFSVVFNNEQDVFTITCDVNFQIDFINSDPQTYRLLGFDKILTSLTTVDSSSNSPRLRDVALYIDIDIPGNGLIKTSGESRAIDTVITIPLISKFREILGYYSDIGSLIYFIEDGTTIINSFIVKIYDEEGNILNLRGGDVFIELVIM
tara:strand:+ start:113 stop:853 length:741 start_codon:yes stop_codon:yes gene_type:complete